MSVINADIAHIFRNVADLLDIGNANPFRVRAYRRAADTLDGLGESVVDLLDRKEDLTELPGIGADLARKIHEIVETGRLAFLEQLQQKAGASFSDMMEIQGLGPRKVKALYDALGVRTVEELEQAALDGSVAGVRGFGEISQENIVKEIRRRRERGRRFLYRTARQAVAPLLEYLRRNPDVKHVEVAGSFRRCRESVGDIDILVTCRRGSRVTAYVTGYDQVSEVVSSGKTRTTVLLSSGLQVDLRVVPEVSRGAALVYFTGSKAHNVALRTRALQKGLKLNEYGLFDHEQRIAGRTEEDVYRKLGLSWITPELRENHGEIEAAGSGSLPRLITLDDIRGDLHMHTRRTDGRNSVREMAEAARAKGYEYIAITEHSRHVTIAGGLGPSELREHCRHIGRVDREMEGIRILKGVEVDILDNGSLDLPDEVLRELDLVIAAVHYSFELPRQRQTQRIVTALQHPLVNVLAHPTGRLIGTRDPCDVDMEAVIRAARDNGCLLEINASPRRLDLDERACRMAAEAGVRMVVGSDAHSTGQLDMMQYGINQARRGWLGPDDVVNTMSCSELLEQLGMKE